MPPSSDGDDDENRDEDINSTRGFAEAITIPNTWKGSDLLRLFRMQN